MGPEMLRPGLFLGRQPWCPRKSDVSVFPPYQSRATFTCSFILKYFPDTFAPSSVAEAGVFHLGADPFPDSFLRPMYRSAFFTRGATRILLLFMLPAVRSFYQDIACSCF